MLDVKEEVKHIFDNLNLRKILPHIKKEVKDKMDRWEGYEWDGSDIGELVCEAVEELVLDSFEINYTEEEEGRIRGTDAFQEALEDLKEKAVEVLVRF